MSKPTQSRSIESFERLIEESSALLAEKGYAEFTLQEVRKRATVSIGSIYRRFNSKEDLIRYLQERELEAINSEFQSLLSSLKYSNGKLKDLFPTVLDSYAEFLFLNIRCWRS